MLKLLFLIVVIPAFCFVALTPGPHQMPLIILVVGASIVNAINKRHTNGS